MGHQHSYGLPASCTAFIYIKNRRRMKIMRQCEIRLEVVFVSFRFFHFLLSFLLHSLPLPLSLAASFDFSICVGDRHLFVRLVCSESMESAARQWWIKSIQSRNCCFIHWTITDIIRHCYYAARLFSPLFSLTPAIALAFDAVRWSPMKMKTFQKEYLR